MTATGASAEPLPPGFTDVSLLTTVGCGPLYRARVATAGGRVEEVGVTVVQTPVHDRGARRRLRNSCLASAALNAEPSVLAIRDVGFTEDHRPFLVTDVPAAGTLADRIGQAGALPPGDAVTLALSMARALDAAHRAGVLHLGIAPDAVFYREDRRPALGHFGLAWAVRPPTMPDVPAAAIVHAPRELFGWEEPTVGSDVYGLASVVRTALTGRAPFEAEAAISRAALYHRLVQGTPPAPVPGMPEPLAKLLDRMMDPDPARRPPLADVIRVFEEVAQIPGLTATGSSRLSPTAAPMPAAPTAGTPMPAAPMAGAPSIAASQQPPAASPVQAPSRPQPAPPQTHPQPAPPQTHPQPAPPQTRPALPQPVVPHLQPEAAPQSPKPLPPQAQPQPSPPQPAPPPAAPASPDPRPRPRNTGLILLVAACLSALVAGIAWGVATAPGKASTPQSHPLVTISPFPGSQAADYEVTDLRVSASEGTYTVSWTQPRNASAVQNYLVVAGLYGTADHTSLVPAGQLSTTFTGLRPGAPYCFTVTTYATAAGDPTPHTATTPTCVTATPASSSAPTA